MEDKDPIPLDAHIKINDPKHVAVNLFLLLE